MQEPTRKEIIIRKVRESIKAGHVYNEEDWPFIFALYAYALCDSEPPDWIKEIKSPEQLKNVITSEEIL